MYCKNCKYWVLDKDDEYNQLIFPYRPDKDYEPCETEEEAASIFGSRVRRCRNPKLLFYQRPEKTGAAVMDGSEYRAELITGEDFGCVGFIKYNVGVELPFLGAEIAFMQLSVPKTKRSAAAPWGGVRSNGLDRRSASGARKVGRADAQHRR